MLELIWVPAPYLGKIQLRWCTSCNLPNLSKKCSSDLQTVQINIAPPGDARPAFTGDISLVNEAIIKDFGEKAANVFLDSIKNKIVLFNRCSYIDRMEEVICDGQILGTLRFDILKNDFKFVPRPAGAFRLLMSKDCKKTVMVDKGAIIPILEGASVLIPGIISFDLEIKKNDSVIVSDQSQELIATGTARINFESIKNMSHGMAVKVRHKIKVDSQIKPLKGPQTWGDVIKANKKVLESAEEEAVQFCRKLIDKYSNLNIPIAVAYSGGKDSLASILLVHEIMGPETLGFFINTCLEFPETIKNIDMIEKVLKIKIIRRKSSKEYFWQQFNGDMGPPSRDNRWCSKKQKLAKITDLIQNYFKTEILTFIGNRKYESTARSRKRRVSRNSWIPDQISASPIHNWTALHVYLYIMKKKKMNLLNPLYFQSLGRIGCWLCPASSLADFKIISTLYPRLYNQLQSHLEIYCKRFGFSDDYSRLALWRWREFPQKIQNFLNQYNIKIRNLENKDT